ncbi:protein-glutamate O-methyltransferase CheR [Granulicella sp. WH15]|uniref:CheR family methyltransferase n=1 Tax=Granulicella sp. WH15 TaxID=2602070 RepID=UPI00136740A9|nr:protein-glutamate O-methyltransferase CheR [Granulicella sp. WH15]QHN04596.1 protein-glutamate O-methyltransferase CheR [Granulicella sp. WH15]
MSVEQGGAKQQAQAERGGVAAERSDAEYEALRARLLAQSEQPERGVLKDTLFEVRSISHVERGGEDRASSLRADEATHLWRSVAEAMMINETSFFRDMKPFDALRDAVLPQLIKQNRSRRRLRIWSAACSTGQEPYSLAILLCEHFPELEQWDVEIIGTDSSRPVLEYARQARYRRLEVNRGLRARLLVKYFDHEGEVWVLKPRLRAMCTFQYVDLCAPLPDLPVFDLVLLRNVLLHLPRMERAAVFPKIREHMSSRGYLLLGQAEQAEDSTDLFRPEIFYGSCFYRAATAV